MSLTHPWTGRLPRRAVGQTRAGRVIASWACIALASCAGTAQSDTASNSSTVTTQAPASTASSAVESTTTTTATTTTARIRTYAFDLEIWLYDAFESVASDLRSGDECFGTANAVSFRRGGRVALTEDRNNATVGTAELAQGTIGYDTTGPSVGDPGSDLFYFCRFAASFDGVPLEAGAFYRFEFPTGPGGYVVTVAEIVDGVSTSLSNDGREEERQRLRSGG